VGGRDRDGTLVTSRRAGGTLKAALDRVYADYDRHPAETADPVHFARRYSEPADREIVAFVAAALAFGRVQSILNTIERVLAVLGPSPASFVAAFDPRRDAASFGSLVHRWTRGEDLAALIWILRVVTEPHGSIEGAFLAGYDPAAADVAAALDRFSERALGVDLAAVYGSRRGRTGVGYFFPRPSRGSACKRLNLFLRWMVRRDGIDLGIWSGVSPSKLVIPLDTHVVRVGQCLGLTRYRSPGWRMAADITASLRLLDPDDPVKYDFAICHVGMRYGCGVSCGRRPGVACPLRSACRVRPSTPAASPRPSDRR
jgi:uncharacterized protein (TIGR02757 family)